MLALLAGEHARIDLGQSVSDTPAPRLRVSREGLALIKSFEGFRPRAVRGQSGGWVIGYGHTASAREGLTVTPADAELLLQYDLLPVVKALNDTVSAGLNQHQFDALASFAVSVGIGRFLSSDVLQRLKEGQPALAADALLGWPVQPAPQDRLRRRAAERALFNADPATSVGFADLMAAPLPFPAQPQEPDARAAAVAVLLGEHPLSAMSVGPFPAVETEPGPEGSTHAHQRYAPYATAPVGPLPGFPLVGAQDREEFGPAASDEPSPFATTDGPVDSLPAADAGTPAPEELEPAADEPVERVAPVLRHEAEAASGQRPDRGGAGPFLIIGAAGLAACGGAAAAFRLALEQLAPLGETMVLAWALALIGVVCVGVSAWNLYQRWGRPD
ncbi:lysozyme [Brevundimonas sp.]|uniref:lysozyme n=1 Tax=Brevundimonas sp. TaxID=1871086 RepID=UPI002ED9FC44